MTRVIRQDVGRAKAQSAPAARNPKTRNRVREVPPDHRLWSRGLTYAFSDVPDNYHGHRQKIVRVNDRDRGIDWAGGDMSAGGHKIGDLAAGVDPGDAVTKAQLDAFDDRITANEQAIIALDARVTQNEQDIQINKDDIVLLQTVVVDLVPAAYGGMTLQDAPEPFTIPTIGFNPLIQFDTNDIVGRGCTMDTSDGTVTIDENFAGVWKFIYSFTLSFIDSNQGRTFYFQFFNATDSQPAGNPVYIPAGRNQEGVPPITISFLALIDQAETGKKFQGQLGDASASISGTMLESLEFDCHYVDRLQNLLDPIADP